MYMYAYTFILLKKIDYFYKRNISFIKNKSIELNIKPVSKLSYPCSLIKCVEYIIERYFLTTKIRINKKK